jgi:hypothetical protein
MEEKITIYGIRNKIVSYFNGIKDDYVDNHWYDEDGYCGGKQFNAIYSYWCDSIDEDKLFSFVIGDWGDIDHSGGRSYFLTHSGIIPDLFSYLVNTLKYDKKKYLDSIYNSHSFTDDIIDLYNSMKPKKDGFFKDETTTIVIKYDKSMRDSLKEHPLLTFINDSKLDGNPIYYLEIPKGGTIVPSFNDMFK